MTLEVRDLAVSARGRPITHAVDLDVARGETVGIVGESGSGKSLTVRAILGLLPAGLSASGSVRLDGTELLGRDRGALERARGRGISLLLQDPATMLDPYSRCGEQVLGADREIAIERLAEAGLDGEAVAERYPFELSGGQRQRVAIAAAVARRPAVLLADEPTSQLDAVSTNAVLALLARLRERHGMGLLLVTHDVGLAFAHCDRVAVLHRGTLVESGAAATLARAPRHAYTRALIAAAAADPAAPAPPAGGGGAPIVRVRDLRVRHGDVDALARVDLDVADGGAVGIVGPSGAGKTTLARCIVRLQTPTAGSIEVAGIQLGPGLGAGAREAVRRAAQIVFQDPASSLNPGLRVRTALREAAALGGGPRRTPAELLALVGLAPRYERRRPAELSGGERQRVAIARALARRPRLLVCDEIVSALDATSRAHILALLGELRRELGLGLLFIAHDLAAVRRVCDTVHVLDAGRIVESGPVERVLAEPRHPRTAELVRAAEPYVLRTRPGAAPD